MELKFKKVILLYVSLILIVLSFMNSALFSNSNDIKLTSLKEAYNISLKAARNWDSKVELCFMTSVDSTVDSNSTFDLSEGLNGKRRYWNFDFAIPNSKKHYIVTIHDGEIVHEEPIINKNSSNMVICKDDISLDSTNAVEKAIQKYKLKPGDGWAIGYHFVLDIINNCPTLTVIGMDSDNNYARISFDVSAGNIISAYHKIIEGGGLYKDNEKINICEDERFIILGAAVNPNENNTIFVWGSTNPVSKRNTAKLLRSDDGGTNWHEINFSYEIIDIHFPSNNGQDNLIYIRTVDHIFTSTDNGLNFKLLYNSNETIYDLCANANDIAILTDSSLRISSDLGKTWEHTATPAKLYSIEYDASSNLYICSNNELYKYENSKWTSIKANIDGRILNFKILNDVLFIHTSNCITLIDINSNEIDRFKFDNVIRSIYYSKSSISEFTIYVDFNNNNLTCLSRGGDPVGWVTKELKMPQNGELIALFPGLEENTHYYCIAPEIIWREMERRITNEEEIYESTKSFTLNSCCVFQSGYRHIR